MKKIASLLTLAALAAMMGAGLAAPADAAGKKAKAKGKSCGEFMYPDKKTGKCMDSRNKK